MSGGSDGGGREGGTYTTDASRGELEVVVEDGKLARHLSTFGLVADRDDLREGGREGGRAWVNENVVWFKKVGRLRAFFNGGRDLDTMGGEGREGGREGGRKGGREGEKEGGKKGGRGRTYLEGDKTQF